MSRDVTCEKLSEGVEACPGTEAAPPNGVPGPCPDRTAPRLGRVFKKCGGWGEGVWCRDMGGGEPEREGGGGGRCDCWDGGDGRALGCMGGCRGAAADSDPAKQ